MRGLILLDGPDCGGKTTLAKAIAAGVEAKGGQAVIHHLGMPVLGQCWEEHSQALIAYIEEMLKDDKVVIADRHFLSEGVYATVYRSDRGGSEYPYTMRFVDMLFDRYRALKVICCPPVEEVVRVHAEMKKVRREEYDSGMDKVARRFERIWADQVMPHAQPGRDYTEQLMVAGGVADKQLWYHYDYMKDNTPLYAGYLLEELEKERWFYGDDTWHLSFTGTPGPLSTLLVGDRASVVNTLHIPFYSNGGSSLFLAKALHKLQVPAERLCIANINDPGGPEAVKYLAGRCNQVIAMGRLAERSLQMHDVKYHAYVRHPQHARRFNHNDDSYVTELAQAIYG